MNKHDNFLRISTKRVEDIIERIKSLKNLKNTSFYSFDYEEIEKLFKDIELILKETKENLLKKSR